jgi:hypothetical protein
MTVNMQSNSGRQVGAAAAFLDAKLAEGRASFSMLELESNTGLTHAAAKQQLLRLKQVRRISRKQDFFLIVRPEERQMGAPPAAEWLDDYFRWLKHPYYLALFSATEVYGSHPQAIQIVQVMTDAMRRDINVGRQRIRFYLKAGIRKTPKQQMPNAPAPLQVSSPEATVLDLIRYATRMGGFSRAEETIVPMLPRLKASGLRAALEAENEAALGQRLGYLLDSAGKKSLASVVEKWLPRRLLWTPLDPSAKADRKHDDTILKWRLVKNTALTAALHDSAQST